ncbi:MAG TPA: TPM domain-containing protein [Candidatus Desulfobacillus sp.]|nr:TPM domain-containing protein [Candidatus Desulfobacillus sp.]
MQRAARILRHLLLPQWCASRAFPPSVLRRIEQAIAASEKRHAAELCFAIEGGLALPALLRGQTARQRALEVFSLLRVWDTACNNGVLIYVQLADRQVDILADRGIAARVAQADWDALCRRFEQGCRQRRFAEGALDAIEEATALLARHFPPGGEGADELPNRPLLL